MKPMKSILFAFFLLAGLLLTSKEVAAQTLTFSQVRMLQLTAPANDTVPAGKVWKVTSFGTNTNTKNFFNLRINGQPYYTYSQGSSSTSAYHAYHGPQGAIWLPAGTTLTGFNSGIQYSFSIIEFDVTP